MHRVVLLPQAEKTFARADVPLARKLARAFKVLENNPWQHANITALVGPLKGWFRFRVGDHRIVYQIDSVAKTVYVARIGHRKEAYE